jgi:hypothetical protein
MSVNTPLDQPFALLCAANPRLAVQVGPGAQAGLTLQPFDPTNLKQLFAFRRVADENDNGSGAGVSLVSLAQGESVSIIGPGFPLMMQPYEPDKATPDAWTISQVPGDSTQPGPGLSISFAGAPGDSWDYEGDGDPGDKIVVRSGAPLNSSWFPQFAPARANYLALPQHPPILADYCSQPPPSEL